jgi:hypothetical protein
MSANTPPPLNVGSPFVGRLSAQPLHSMDAQGSTLDRRLDSRARNALVLGICAFVPVVGVVLAICAIAVGRGALRHIEASGGATRGVGIARTGIVLGCGALMTSVATVLALRA